MLESLLNVEKATYERLVTSRLLPGDLLAVVSLQIECPRKIWFVDQCF